MGYRRWTTPDAYNGMMRHEVYVLPGFVAVVRMKPVVDLGPIRYYLTVARKLPGGYRYRVTTWPSRLAAKVAFLRWRRHAEEKIAGLRG